MSSDSSTTGDLTLATIERRHIRRILALTGNDKKKASGLLGIHYTTLLRKLEQYELDG